MFCYFLMLFLQLWYICPIVQMGKLMLKKLADSHIVKKWQRQDSHPGVSDPTPGVPMLPPLRSLALEMNISPPVFFLTCPLPFFPVLSKKWLALAFLPEMIFANIF